MESISQSIQNLNMPSNIKMRMKNFIENQQKRSSKQFDESLNLLEKNKEYECAKCQDLTFIIVDDEAVPCECRALRQAEEILRKSGVSTEFRNKTFENYNCEYDQQTILAYKLAMSYVKDFELIENSRRNSIILMGQSGAGKSHLSLSIANELMDMGIGVIYMPYRDVITKIKQNIIDEVYYHREMNRYKNARVLLIDDLFKSRYTDSDINIMFELLNYRYFNNLPIIVSTELMMDELLNVDEALGSRIIEMSREHLVTLKGEKLNFRIYGD